MRRMIPHSSDRFQFSRYSMSQATRFWISALFRASRRGNPRTCAETGDAGLHKRADVIVRHAIWRKLIVVFDQVRARSDDAHVAEEHVPELRHFIDAQFAKPFPERINAVVVSPRLAISSPIVGRCVRNL